MRLSRSSTALLAAALAAAGASAQNVQLPKLEEMANLLLSAQGIQQALADGGGKADAAAAYGSQSEVWSAFLNAASENLEGGSIQAYASKFEDLKCVCCLVLTVWCCVGGKVDSSRDGVPHPLLLTHFTYPPYRPRDGDASGIFNSAVPGEVADGSSITTLNLGVNMNKQLNQVRPLFAPPRSPFSDARATTSRGV